MIATLQLSAQSYNYSYTDPCTGQLKTLSVPINGSVAISYYGQIQNFSPAELQNGTFGNWTSSVYNEFGGNNPCATLVGLPTAINITQGTVYTTIGIINSLTTLADLTSSISSVADIASGTTNILGGSVGTIGNSDSGSDSNNSNGNGTKSSNGNTTSSGSNQTTSNTQTNATSTQGSGGSNTQSGNSTSSTNNSNAGGNQSSQSSVSTPSQSNSTSVSQPTSTSNSNNSANVNTNSNGSNSTQSTSNSSNNVSPSTPAQGSNSSSSGSQVPGSSPVQNSTTSSQSTEGGQTNITAGGTQTIASSNNSESGGSGGGSKSAAQKESGGKPTVIASSDFVGFNFKDSDVTTGVKATGGYTSLRWDGGAAHGILADYTSANKGPNITVFQAWIKKKSTTLVSGTLTIGFEGYGSQYVTAAIGQVRPIKKVKVVYMATCSVGKVYKEAFIGTAVIVGGMYDFKITKRFDIKVMNLFVYAPYVSYLDDVVMKSPYVMIPSIGTNIGITKRFKFNINAGGAWALGDDALNYTVTMGTRLLL